MVRRCFLESRSSCRQESIEERRSELYKRLLKTPRAISSSPAVSSC
ncbi:MAG TPA: hypothetical protein PKG77_21390 [Phycisphaerae bacterium]|nr:hypothetical protein [Phycisphaerae bacterium]HQL71537.1 hypothetical protein [Phycisphaerae bacterium]